MHATDDHNEGSGDSDGDDDDIDHDEKDCGIIEKTSLAVINHRYSVYADCIEVTQFSFGSGTPHIKDVHAYECVDGVGGGKRPITWSSVMQPPSGPLQSGTCQLVLEADITVQSDDFILVLRSHMAGKWCDSEHAAVVTLFTLHACVHAHILY